MPNFDYSMAEGIGKTFRKQYRAKLREALEDLLDTDDETALVQAAIEAGKQATGDSDVRLETHAATFDDAAAKAIAATGRLDAGKAAHLVGPCAPPCHGQDRPRDVSGHGGLCAQPEHHALARRRPNAFLVHQLRHRHIPRGRMAIRNILLAEDAGLGHGETPIFPIHIFKVKEGVNYNPGDPNYDLFELSCKVSAKRLFPNYVFLDSPFNLQYYKPGHPETEVATMGCRTRVMGNVYDPERQIAYSRGNLSLLPSTCRALH